MKPRILIDGIAVSHPQPGGYKTYATNLVRSLAEHDPAHEYVVAMDRPLADELRGSTVTTLGKPGSLRVVWREQVQLPRLARQVRADLLHSPTATAPVKPPVPLVVTLYDVIEFTDPLPSPRQAKRWAMRVYSRLTQKQAARGARQVLTVSEYSRQQIMALLRVPGERIAVTHLAHAALFRPLDRAAAAEQARRRFGAAGCVLGIASAAPRKNTRGLLEAYAALPRSMRAQHPLLLVCTHDSLRVRLEQAATELGLARGVVIFAEGVSDDDLLLLYNAASLFVFPSLQEGFGLPPLEAMACGTPVVASRCSSLPEVIGEAGMLVAPGDTASLAAALANILSDPALAASLAGRGIEQAGKFSWAATARAARPRYTNGSSRADVEASSPAHRHPPSGDHPRVAAPPRHNCGVPGRRHRGFSRQRRRPGIVSCVGRPACQRPRLQLSHRLVPLHAARRGHQPLVIPLHRLRRRTLRHLRPASARAPARGGPAVGPADALAALPARPGAASPRVLAAGARSASVPAPAFDLASAIPLGAAALGAVYAYFVLYGAMVQTEALFICALVWSLERGLALQQALSNPRAGRSPLAAGLTLGLSLGIATLLRQSILPWVAVMFVYLLIGALRAADRKPGDVRGAVLPLVLAGAVIVACILPFTIRNYRAYGSFLLLNSNAGYAMYSAQHPGHGTSFREYWAAPLPADLAGQDLNEAEWDKALMQRGIGFILADPVRYLRLSLSRISDYVEFWPTADSSFVFNAGRMVSIGLFLPFMLGGVAYALTRRGRAVFDLPGTTFLLLFMSFYSALHIFTWAMSRYRLPVDAAALPFASLALCALAERLARGRLARTEPA